MKVLSRINLNLKHSQGLPMIRQLIWLLFTPINPILNSSNKISVLSNVLERKILFFLRGKLQVSTCPASKVVLHGSMALVVMQYLSV